MHLVLLALAAAFAVLLVLRVSAARRALLARRWPALALAAGAAIALTRGSIRLALLLAVFAAAAWFVAPLLAQRRAAPADDGLAQARRILGVGPNASDEEIRRAYRKKMAAAHPDRGGGHEQAARLTEARDRLLKRKPR